MRCTIPSRDQVGPETPLRLQALAQLAELDGLDRPTEIGHVSARSQIDAAAARVVVEADVHD